MNDIQPQKYMQKKESTDKFAASMIYLCLVKIIQNDRFLLSNPTDCIDVDTASKWSVGEVWQKWIYKGHMLQILISCDAWLFTN